MKKLILCGLIAFGLNAYELNLKSGWQLLGAISDVNTQVFDNSNIGSVWSYDDIQRKWQVYIPSNSFLADKYSSMDNLSIIKKGCGFWVYAKESLTIDTQKLTEDTDDNTSYPASTNKLSIQSAIYDYVGTSPVILDENKIDESIDYSSGANIDGKLYSWADIVNTNSKTMVFSVDVPDDDMYGIVKGETLKYVAYLMYPTTSENNYKDEYFGPEALPKMQNDLGKPLFADDEKHPLLIYSHGYGSNPVEGTGFMKEFVKRGYLVMGIWHCDNRFDSSSPEVITLRPLTISKAIDYILSNDDYKDHIDESKIAVLGESFGGLSAVAVIGSKIMNWNTFSLMDVKTDSRIKAAIGIVPYFGGPETYNYSYTGSNGTASVFAPYLAIAGDSDDVANFSLTQKAVEDIPTDKYLIKLIGLGHELNTMSYQYDNLAWSLTFLDAYLNNNEDSKDILKNSTSYDGGVDDIKVEF